MNRISLRNPIFLSVLIFVAYLAGMWGTSLPLTGDQKVYLSVALEMWEKNEWIIPSLFGEPNFLKPPFQYWATIFGWKLFGLSIFGAIIPSVLAMLGSALLTFRIGSKIGIKNPEIASLLFASSLGTMTYGSTAQMEIWIVFFLLGAWFSILNSRYFLSFFLVGIMAWVKGPLYPVLWTMSVLVWNRKLLREKKFLGALAIGTFIGLGWYLLAAQTHRQEMLQQFFLTENLAKMNTRQGNVLGLWTEFFASLMPWGFLLIVGALQEGTRERWKNNQKFYLSYSVVLAIFFTIFPYRVNSYLYFLTPLMAMMASEIELENQKRGKGIAIGFYLVIFSVLALMLFQLQKSGWIGTEILVSGSLAILIFLAGLFQGIWRQIALASLLLVNLIRVSAVQIGEKDVGLLKQEAREVPREFAYYIDSRDIWHEYGLVSAAIGQPVRRIYKKEELDSFLATHGTVILQEDQTALISEKMNCVEWHRLKRRTKFPMQRLLKDKVSWGDAEIMRKSYLCSNK